MERLSEWLRSVYATSLWLVRETASSLRYNWGIAILSLGLAIALWVFVTDRQNPDVEGRVPGTLSVEAVNVPSDQAVSSLSQTTVSVRVRAPENVFDDLTADDFRATIDLSSVTSQEATVDVHVDAERTRVEILEVQPARIAVQLENVTSLAVPIRAHLVGAPPRGFEVGATTVEPEEAVVTGPQSLVERVDAVEGDVSLTGLPTSFEQTLVLRARDASGGNIEGVTIGPASARISVELKQLEFSAVFPVLPDVTGTPQQGFRVTGLQVDPPFVVVSGMADVFQTLDPTQGVHTEPVIIDGASADVVRPVALRLPQGASVLQATVTVRVTIAPLSQP